MALASDPIFKKIVDRIGKIDPNDRKVLHIYKFNVTKGGKVVKSWVLDLKNVKLIEGDAPGVECTLTCDDDVMVAMGTGKLSAREAIAQDKLDIDGDLALALLLEPFVSTL